MDTINLINQIADNYYKGTVSEKNEVANLLAEKGITVYDIRDAFRQITENEDERSLSSILLVMTVTDIYSSEYLPFLRKLLVSSWHKCHEDIMLTLEFDIRDPDCVDDVAMSMHIKFDYMLDDGDAFIRKGAYVLGTLRTAYAIQKLNELSADENEIISKYCSYQLRKINGEHDNSDGD